MHDYIYIVFLYAFVNIFYIVVKETFGENLYNLLLTGENVYTYKRLIYFQKHDFRSFWRITDDIFGIIQGKKLGQRQLRLQPSILK